MKEISWRDFQSEYIINKKKKNLFVNTVKTIISIGILMLLITGIFFFKNQIAKGDDTFDNTQQENLTQLGLQASEVPTQLLKTQLTRLIKDTKFNHTDKNIFFIDTPDENYKITTTIDIYLQEYLLSQLDRLKRLTRGKPQKMEN